MTLMLGGVLFLFLYTFRIFLTRWCPGPIHEFAPDGTCVIGLKPFGYIPLLTYDVYVHLNLSCRWNCLKMTSGTSRYISIFLTVMFLVPLLRTDQLVQPKFKRLAIRTLMCAFFDSFHVGPIIT